MDIGRRSSVGLAGLMALAFVAWAHAADRSCLACHAALSQRKVVHAPVHGGCAACHPALDASTVPHKPTGRFRRGLSNDVPALCAQCHDRKLFEGKVVHAPVAGAALCLTCHDPHASNDIGLLKKAPAALCLDCHPDVVKKPHVVAGISRKGHPLGDENARKDDPLRPGKPFYCASCHEPHRSDEAMLTRYGRGMSSCQKCHKV